MALKVCVYLCVSTVHVVHVCTLYMYMYVFFDYVVDCTGSSESADPNTTGGGVTSKSECLVFVCMSQMHWSYTVCL